MSWLGGYLGGGGEEQDEVQRVLGRLQTATQTEDKREAMEALKTMAEAERQVCARPRPLLLRARRPGTRRAARSREYR